MTSTAFTKIKNAGWLLLERGVGVLIAFFVMTLVARHLGPDTFGSYAYMFSLSALLLPLAQFGLNAIVMREIGRDTEQSGTLLGSAIAIQTGGGLAAYGLAILFVTVFGGPSEVTVALMLIAGIQLLAAPSEVLNAWFHAKERMVWIVVPRTLVALGLAAVALYLVLNDAPFERFVTLRGAESVLFALAALVFFGWVTKALHTFRVSWAMVKTLLRDGWPLALSAVAVIIYMRIDQVMLGQLSSETELGLYSIAVRVADVALIVPVALNTSIFASIVRAQERGPDALTRLSQYAYDAMIIAALCTMAAVALASYVLFVPIFGQAYAAALPMVFILLLGLPWVALGQARGTVLVSKGWLWSSTLTTSIGAVANIGLNLLLIPKFGGIGAAWATVIAYWLAAHGTCFLFKHLRPIGALMTQSLNPFAAGARLYRKFTQEGAT